MQFWALQDRGDPEPYGVAAKDDQGIPRLFVPGMGLVHMPSVADITHWGEVGGKRITEVEAYRLMRAGVGKLTPQIARSYMGSAPTIPVEMESGSLVTDTSKRYVAFPRGRRPTREEALEIGRQLFDAITVERVANTREEGEKEAQA